MWSRPVPIQLLYQQLSHSGNFFHNAAVRTDAVMTLFVLITTNRSSWSPHTLSIKDCHVLESFTPAFYRVATGSLDRSVVIYDVHQATVVLRLSFPASIQSLMTCNLTQDFLNVWDSIDSRLIGESRLNQARPDEAYHYLYPPTGISIYSSLSINFIIIIIMKVTDTS